MNGAAADWHARTTPDALGALQSAVTRLAGDEAARRLDTYGSVLGLFQNAPGEFLARPARHAKVCAEAELRELRHTFLTILRPVPITAAPARAVCL